MTLSMDRETFVAHAGDVQGAEDDVDTGDPAVIRVATEIESEITPLSAYAALTGRTTDADAADHAFLLESGGKTAASDPDGAFRPSHATTDRHARYSFVGYDPEAVVTVGDDGAEVDVLGDDRYGDLIETNGGDVVDELRATMPDVRREGFDDSDRQRLDGGLVGFLGYDAVYDLWLDEVGVERPESRFPDAEFVLATRVLTFDDVEDSIELVFTPVVRPEDDAGAIYDSLAAEAERVESLLADAEPPETGGFDRVGETAGPREEYEDAVRQAKEHVLDGDIYQGVLSRKRELYGSVDPIGFYAALREVNPSPYMYLLAHDDCSIVGASPETLVSVLDESVMVNPIAGTCPRGAGPVEDRRLAGEMLADDKERAEHTMLVDLGRNDVRRVAEPGSVRVDEFMGVLKYSHVQHIESTVTATLAEHHDAFDATRATFPAGTLSGAPKIRAMEIIDELERSPRGPYGGGVGFYSWSGDAVFAIVIRTATVESGVDPAAVPDAAAVDADAAAAIDGSLDRITVQAGAGIVADSDPTAEFEETESKMDGTLAALERIEDGAARGEGERAAPADATAERSAQGGGDGEGPATEDGTSSEGAGRSADAAADDEAHRAEEPASDQREPAVSGDDAARDGGSVDEEQPATDDTAEQEVGR
ncbi:anthranilate synthase component I [Salinarchaeum sp. Harcht-Bsk1]|uniref:anthranilate synthase component I n=1 Tax=Salinarchaeum sp. Harcht-Bsk1 TaxID=1333523 RepID=UPI0003422FC7|nr:anthranilate synthase component I [Salinarchaeum sp. Harcht-Bsk1]AGN01711.1 anthranilate synthase component I [Salinarchaeum sp. Harcht-Bsk1]